MRPHYRMPALRPGMRVHVIAPSSPFPTEDFERGIARLRTRYEVSYDPAITSREGYLAGSDARRANELIAALRDPAVHAIVAARGGYGATRILPSVPVALIAAHPKLLVGYSDVSALHALYASAGRGSLHAAMVAGLGRSEEPLLARWFAAVEGACPQPLAGLHAIAGGRARGRLFGGNLAVLCALAGTPFAPPLDGVVLFLEDINERPYRVDRMFTQLAQAGWLDSLAAIALGSFRDAEPGPDGVRIEAVFSERLSGLGIPVVSGVPAGHVDDNLELPFGATVEVDAERGTLAFEAAE